MLFVIPVIWSMTAEVPVEANTLDEAKQKALLGSPPGMLPMHGATYLPDSFVVDDDSEVLERASLLSPEPLPSNTDSRCRSTLAAWDKHAPNCSCPVEDRVFKGFVPVRKQ
jgi:hypothetical protein